MLLEPAEILGTELAEAAVTVAKDPTEIIQIDVPFQYVDKGSIATVGPEIERRIPENDMPTHEKSEPARESGNSERGSAE